MAESFAYNEVKLAARAEGGKDLTVKLLNHYRLIQNLGGNTCCLPSHSSKKDLGSIQDLQRNRESKINRRPVHQ